MFINHSDFDKKPVALLMSSEADTPIRVTDRVIRASKRYIVLSRIRGALTSSNQAWRKDANGVWHTVGDMSLVYEEEL